MAWLAETLLPLEWRALLLRPWWSWAPEEASPGDLAYHWFNLAEAAAWFAIAVVIIKKRIPASHKVDCWLAGTLILFGLSDVTEAWAASIPLLAVKLVILIALLVLRKRRSTLRAESRVAPPHAEA